MSDCSFCDELSTGLMTDPILDGFWKVSESRIVWESEEHWVIPSLGPLTETHYLICTRDHYPSLRDAPISVLQSLLELLRAIEVLKINAPVPTTILWFENGNAVPQMGKGECVDHVHVHIIAVPTQVAEAVIEDFVEIAPVNVSDELVQTSEETRYVFAGFQGRYFIKTSADIHSQIMRKRVAAALEKDDHWNWRDQPNVKLMQSMKVESSSFLQDVLNLWDRC